MNGLCKICDTNHWEPQDHPFTPRAAAPPQVPSPVLPRYRCDACKCVFDTFEDFHEHIYWHDSKGLIGKGPTPGSEVSREPLADSEMLALLMELIEKYHLYLYGSQPDSHCRICQIYLRANSMKLRAGVSREPISAEQLEHTEAGAIAIGIIQLVVSDALRLAATRWNLEISEEENGMGDLDDMVDDTMKCLVGEDYGCLDPEDADDQAKIFQTVRQVAGKLQAYARAAARTCETKEK